MPPDDVSDLRDVVDAINRLCDTMKTSHYDHEPDAPSPEVTYRPIVTEISSSAQHVKPDSDVMDTTREVSISETEAGSRVSNIEMCELAAEIFDCVEATSPEEQMRVVVNDRWSDSVMSLMETVASDTEPAAQCEPSEMYYTASSEVSLLSDTEIPERIAVDEELIEGREGKDDRKECVIAGHVAAMRERFESMTRTNTPCPDLMRSSSPSLDIFRNITPSPDRLG